MLRGNLIEKDTTTSNR